MDRMTSQDGIPLRMQWLVPVFHFPFGFHSFRYMIFISITGIAGKCTTPSFEALTFKTANGGDIWLHALNYHGSHTIIFTEGEVPPDDVITFAAQVTAYYSAGANSDKVAVDYTMKKFVKRNPNGKLGMVTYTNQKTAYVRPEQYKDYKKEN